MDEKAIIGQLLLSAFLGGAIGFVREKDKKAAGLRTHMLVCVGSTLFMLISIFLSTSFPNTDVSRIASQVITATGFIGAGAIIHAEGAIKGLTTATSVWICAAIGLAVGCGFYLGAAVVTLITLIVIEVVRKLEIAVFYDNKTEN